MPGEPDLRILASGLRSFMAMHGLTQGDMARACGVDQSLISRIATGEARRWSPRVEKVSKHIFMRLCPTVLPDEVKRAVDDFLKVGGDKSLLCKQIHLLKDMHLGASGSIG